VGYTEVVSDFSIQTYLGYQEEPYAKVAERLRAMGARRVGLEFNYCPKSNYDRLASELPTCEFVDVWTVMDEVRWIKTPSEVAILKHAADLLDDAYLEALPTIRAGETERDAHARMMKACIEKGFGWTHGILNSHRNEVMYNGERDFVFESGDLVRTDYVAYLSGYPGHQSRNVVLGSPSRETMETYKKVREVYGILADHIKAGSVVGNLYELVVAEFDKRGLRYSSLLIGHSVGPWFHQQEPIMRRGSATALEEGMVLALEPYIGSYHIQDMVLVERDGCRLLSDRIDTRALWIV
jgi:Xaa-Pro aminopeptidase